MGLTPSGFSVRKLKTVAVDDTTTSGTTYIQYEDGEINKWTDNVRYTADNGTLWVNRATANYTANTI